MKNILWLYLIVAMYAHTSFCYDFCQDNKDVLSNYNLYKQFGGEDPERKLTVEKDLPYLEYEKNVNGKGIFQNFLLNLCGNEIDTSSENKLDLSKYSKNSLLYATKKQDSEDFYSDVVNIINKDLDSDSVDVEEFGSNFDGLLIKLNNQNYYNFSLHFHCDRKLKVDKITSINKNEAYVENFNVVYAFWHINLTGPSGCLVNPKKETPYQPPLHAKKSHSFFFYFFIYVIIFTAIYIGATSYLEVRDGGTLQDFEDTFKNKFRALMFAIPAFSKELYNKLMGNSSSRYNPAQFSNESNSDNRSGYAAV
ncbi:hypothetical protein QEN19_002836 [Hanseniaspora menglaensis]